MIKRILAFTTVVLIGCSSPEIVGGSSSETTNGIIVVASNGIVSGKVATGSTVMIFDRDYNPYEKDGFSDEIVITEGQDFRFDVPLNNSYNIVAYNNSRQSLLVSDITVAVHSTSEHRSAFSNSGKLEIFSDFNEFGDTYPVYIKGTPFVDIPDDIGGLLHFSIDDLPIGTYDIFIEGKNKEQTGPDLGPYLGDIFTIISDSITKIDG